MAKKHLASALKQTSGNSKPGPAPIRAVPAPVKRKGSHTTSRPAPTQPSTGGGKYGSQVQAESDLRFGPQQSALAALLSQAVADRTQGIEVQKSTGRGLIALSSRAQPQVAQIQQQGLEQIQQPYQRLQQDFSTLASNADPIKAAAMRDAAQAQAQQVSAANRAAVELKQRQVDALAGRQAGISAVQSQAAEQISQIGQQASSLAGQQGAFAQSRVAQLVSDAEKQANANRQASLGRGVTKRGQDISHEDRVAGRRPKPGSVSATGHKLQTGEKHDAAREKVTLGLRVLSTLDPDRNARHDTAPGLVAGAPAIPGKPKYREVKDPNTGKVTQQRVLENGTQATTGDLPAIPALGQWATVAADVYYDGHLSRANQKKLANAGYSLGDLGLPTYAQWKKQGGRKPRSTKVPGNISVPNPF